MAHEVHFHSGARPDLMIGTNISHFLITEVGTQKEEVYTKAQTRTRCPKAKVRQGLCEGTPEGFNWYQERADFGGGVPDAYDPVNLARRFTLWTEDNQRLPADYVEKLRRTFGYDQAKLESYLYGRFVAFTKGTAYWEFFASRNVVLDVKPSPFLPLVFSWDFGVSPLPWVAIQKQPHEKRGRQYRRFVQVAEGSGNARGVLDGCAEFISQFPPSEYRGTKIEIDGGHDGYHGSHLAESCAFNQIRDCLRRYYDNVVIVAMKSAPTVQESLNKTNALFAYELSVVAAWCRNTIKSFEQSSLKNGTWELLKPKDADPTHFGDAHRAAIFRLTQGIDIVNPNREKVLGFSTPL